MKFLSRLVLVISLFMAGFGPVITAMEMPPKPERPLYYGIPPNLAYTQYVLRDGKLYFINRPVTLNEMRANKRQLENLFVKEPQGPFVPLSVVIAREGLQLEEPQQQIAVAKQPIHNIYQRLSEQREQQAEAAAEMAKSPIRLYREEGKGIASKKIVTNYYLRDGKLYQGIKPLINPPPVNDLPLFAPDQKEGWTPVQQDQTGRWFLNMPALPVGQLQIQQRQPAIPEIAQSKTQFQVSNQTNRNAKVWVVMEGEQSPILPEEDSDVIQPPMNSLLLIESSSGTYLLTVLPDYVTLYRATDRKMPTRDAEDVLVIISPDGSVDFAKRRP